MGTPPEQPLGRRTAQKRQPGRKRHVKRYHAWTVLPGGFPSSQAGSENKIIWNACIYCILIYCGQPLGIPCGDDLSDHCHQALQCPGKIHGARLKSIMFLLLLSVSFNLFLTPGTPIFKIGFLQMTWEGLRFAAFMAIRLVYLVMGSTILTLTTTRTS